MSALDDLIDEQRKHEREYEIHASDWMSDPAVAELATLRAELAAAQRTIEAREKSVLEIWQDWIEANARADEMQVYYIEEKSRHAAGALAAQQDEARLTRERDEAQKANKAYTVLIALDRDEIAELNRRIAELESEKLMSDGMIVGLNVALKIKDEEIEELTPPIIEGLAL